MPTIMQFKAQMSAGFARPNLFKVEIAKVKTSKQRLYQMSCFQAQIPGHNLATTDKDIAYRSIAYQKIFSDVILGFYVDGDLAQLKYWQEWIDQIIDPTTNHHRYYNDYISTVKITQVNRSGQPVATWTLHDAYPKQVDPVQLDYGTNDAIMTCNVTLTYRHFTVKWHTVVKIIPKEDSRSGEEEYLVTHDEDDEMMHPITGLGDAGHIWSLQDGTPDASNYIGWDTMSQQQKNIVLEYYRLHGPSKTGGAFHHI